VTQTLNKAIGYVRVSTDKQADFGVSLEAQREKIEAMAVVQGVELIDIIVDAGESAKSLRRPGMERLLAAVDSRAVQCVIIAKLDRLTRSVKDLGELLERLQKRGVSLVSVADSLDTASAAGRLVMNIMMSVSQWEREAIGERTRDALRHKKSKRQAYSPTPYGFERNGAALTSLAGEAGTIGQIQQWRTGGFTLRQIAGELNRAGVPTKNGGAAKWYASTVRSILSNSLHMSAAA
jgi:site-specific DNA recombinase